MKPDAHPTHSPHSQPNTNVLASLWAGKQNLLLAILGIYVLVLPIAQTIALRGLTFVGLLVLTLALLAERKTWPQFPLWQAWLAYATVGLVAVFLASDPNASATEFRAEFIFCYAVFMIGMIWGDQFRSFKSFALILATTNLVLVSFAFMFAGVGTSFWSMSDIPPIARAGLNSNWILVVIFLNAWLSLGMWQEGRRVLSLVLAGLIGLDIWAMLVGYNRQTWLALGAGVLCWGLAVLYRNFSWRRSLPLALILGVVIMLLSFQLHRHANILEPGKAPASMVEEVRSALVVDPRWEIWRFSLEKIAERPLVGVGLGRYGFRRAYPEFQPDVVNHWHAHNMILNKGIQMGVPGMLTFVFLWFALARELANHVRTSVAHRNLAVAGLSIVAAVFAKNMTDDFFVRDVALMFWLVMGLLIGVLRSTRPTGASTGAATDNFRAPAK